MIASGRMRPRPSCVVRDEAKPVTVRAKSSNGIRAAGDRLTGHEENALDVEQNPCHGRARLYPRHTLSRDSARGDRAALLTLERTGRPARAEVRDAGGSGVRRRSVRIAHGCAEAKGHRTRGRGAAGDRPGRAKPGPQPGARARTARGPPARGTPGPAQARCDRADDGGEGAAPRREAAPSRAEAPAPADRVTGDGFPP